MTGEDAGRPAMTRATSAWVVPGSLLAVGLAAYPALAHHAAPPVVGIGALAVLLFIAAQTLPLPGALAWSLGLLATEYLVTLALTGDRLDVGSPAYAAVFFLCAELGWVGLEARRGRRLWPSRAVAVALLALAGAALGAVLLFSAAFELAGGAALTGLGVAAAVAVAACLAWLARH